jgi:hypothetical protein
MTARLPSPATKAGRTNPMRSSILTVVAVAVAALSLAPTMANARPYHHHHHHHIVHHRHH